MFCQTCYPEHQTKPHQKFGLMAEVTGYSQIIAEGTRSRLREPTTQQHRSPARSDAPQVKSPRSGPPAQCLLSSSPSPPLRRWPRGRFPPPLLAGTGTVLGTSQGHKCQGRAGHSCVPRCDVWREKLQLGRISALLSLGQGHPGTATDPSCFSESEGPHKLSEDSLNASVPH